jgi:AcrR family transcriptional regulator
MRVTAEAKLATRRRILEAARDCFSKAGFEAATTRDIAAAAGIAAGTLFNYFPAKEAIAMALVAEALGAARRRFDGRPRGESLEEDLFTLIAEELRALRPHRGYLRPVLETALSPLARAEASPEGEEIRVEHLEAVGRLIANRASLDRVSRSGEGDPPRRTGEPLSNPARLEPRPPRITQGRLGPLSPAAWSLYWTLYTGVLAFWACDSSRQQEDTLAVLDHYLRAFVGSLSNPE